MAPYDPDVRLGPDFDHKDVESAEDPFRRWKHLRDNEPIATSTHYGGYHVISRYDDVCEAARDYEVFSSAEKNTLPMNPHGNMPPVDYDPPIQRDFRMLLNPWFSPSKVASYQPWIDDIAASLMVSLVERGEFDVTTEFALRIGLSTICRIMGLTNPPEDLPSWFEDLLNLRGIDDARANAGAAKILAFLEQEVRQEWNHPRDDLIGSICRAKIDGKRLEFEQVVLMMRVVLSGGLETTSFSISGTVWYLLQHPEVMESLQADESLWVHALDEFVRWTSPVAGIARTVHRETELSGCPMHVGDKVWLLFGSANRDELEFANPDEIIPDRFPNRHVGFGLGPHRCVGSHLAKAMLTAGLREILKILPDWELGDPEKVYWVARETHGLKNLPLVRRSF